MVPLRQLFVDGEWRAPAQGRRLPVVSPATEAHIGEHPPLATPIAHLFFFLHSLLSWLFPR